jgi:uncharacterized protein
VPGSVSATWGYRRELTGQRSRLLRLIPMSMLGGLTGSILLLALPGSYFKRIVPFLVLLGVALVIAQPRVQAAVNERRKQRGSVRAGDHIGPLLQLGVFLTGIYGGYFGAAQGVILMGLMGIALTDDLQRINATKNALATTVNATAAVVFIVRGDVPWGAAGFVAVGSIIGALIGAHIGRRIPAKVLRGVIVVVGITVATKLLLS